MDAGAAAHYSHGTLCPRLARPRLLPHPTPPPSPVPHSPGTRACTQPPVGLDCPSSQAQGSHLSHRDPSHPTWNARGGVASHHLCSSGFPSSTLLACAHLPPSSLYLGRAATPHPVTVTPHLDTCHPAPGRLSACTWMAVTPHLGTCHPAPGQLSPLSWAAVAPHPGSCHLSPGWLSLHLGTCCPSSGRLSPLTWAPVTSPGRLSPLTQAAVTPHLGSCCPSPGQLSQSSPSPSLSCGPNATCVCAPQGKAQTLPEASHSGQCSHQALSVLSPLPRMFFPAFFVSIWQSLLGHSTSYDLSGPCHYLGTVPPLATVPQWRYRDHRVPPCAWTEPRASTRKCWLTWHPPSLSLLTPLTPPPASASPAGNAPQDDRETHTSSDTSLIPHAQHSPDQGSQPSGPYTGHQYTDPSGGPPERVGLAMDIRPPSLLVP